MKMPDDDDDDDVPGYDEDDVLSFCAVCRSS